MDELIIRFLQNRATREDEFTLREWRLRSPDNERYFREMELVWGELRDSEPDTRPPLTATLIARAERSGVVPIAHRSTSGPARWRRAALAAAATVLLVLGGGLVLRQSLADGPSLAAMELATGPGETTMTQLSDGTIVHLAPNSYLRVSSTRGYRDVEMEGRAFFGVAKHADWPFRVWSRVGRVQVLGTRFEFSTQDGDARVIVVDGQVALSTAGETVRLRGGQMSMTPPNGRPIVTAYRDVDRLLDWMGQSLVFHETPLSQAAREIEARYGVEVEIRSEGLASQTVSGGFKDRGFEYVVATICRVVYAECEITESGAVISARS